MSYIAIISIFAMMLVITFTDFRTKKIPNEIIMIGIVLAIIIQTTGALKQDWLTLLIDFLIFFIPLMLLWIIGTLTSFQALAAGDVKLISVMALYIAPSELWVIVLASLIFVSFANVTKIDFSFYKEMPKEIYYFVFFGIPGKPKERLQNVPFGPFIAIVTIIYISYIHLI